MPIRAWLRSTNFAIEGILHAARTQRHLRYHFYAAGAVLLLSYALGVSKGEFLVIALAVMAVLVAEMMNTAVEAVVDIITPDEHPGAKAAKDIAAGAVLITAFGSAVIGYIVLFPYIRRTFTEGFRIAHHTTNEIVIIAVILVLIAVLLLKAYVRRGLLLKGGLPSGHASLAFSVWVSVMYITENFLVSLLVFVLASVIAAARVTSGVHRWFEVVIGALLGALITVLMFEVFL